MKTRTLSVGVPLIVLLAGCSGGGGSSGADEIPTPSEDDNTLPAGTLDRSFGNNGIVVDHNAAGGNDNDFGSAITTDSLGRILVTGMSRNASGNMDMVIWRYNADGTPDTTFNPGSSHPGIVVHSSAAGWDGNDSGRSLTRDSQGRILVTGYSSGIYNTGFSYDPDMVIWRYKPDGTLDTTFNPGGTIPGIVVHDSAAGGNGQDWGFSITTDSQERILVSGWSWNSAHYADMVIWRYNPDGSLDTSFGNNGIVVHDNAAGGNGNDGGYSITTDSQGRILVAGSSYNGSDDDMAIWCYKTDGTLDTTFGNNGIVISDGAAGGYSGDSAASITVDSQGRILVTGFSWNAANNADMVIWRYDSNGLLDLGFGNNGVVIHDGAAGVNGNDYGNSITTDSLGRILVTGRSSNTASDEDMVIWRYNPDGTLDTTFGNNGVVTHNGAAGGNSTDSGISITLDAQERILVTGKSLNDSGNYDMVIWRYTP